MTFTFAGLAFCLSLLGHDCRGASALIFVAERLESGGYDYFVACMTPDWPCEIAITLGAHRLDSPLAPSAETCTAVITEVIAESRQPSLFQKFYGRLCKIRRGES